MFFPMHRKQKAAQLEHELPTFITTPITPTKRGIQKIELINETNKHLIATNSLTIFTSQRGNQIKLKILPMHHNHHTSL